jgi:hypothetical protein
MLKKRSFETASPPPPCAGAAIQTPRLTTNSGQRQEIYLSLLAFGITLTLVPKRRSSSVARKRKKPSTTNPPLPRKRKSEGREQKDETNPASRSPSLAALPSLTHTHTHARQGKVHTAQTPVFARSRIHRIMSLLRASSSPHPRPLLLPLAAAAAALLALALLSTHHSTASTGLPRQPPLPRRALLFSSAIYDVGRTGITSPIYPVTGFLPRNPFAFDSWAGWAPWWGGAVRAERS